jgi:preprotein translocase subunit YajC
MSNLEAVGFAGINGAPERLETLHEERADEVRLEATSLGLFHFFLYREQALRAHAFRGKCLSVEDGDHVVAVEGIVDFLAKTGANFRLVAIADGFQQHFLEAVALKDFAEDVKHLTFKRFAHHAKLFEQAKIDIALAGFLGD